MPFYEEKENIIRFPFYFLTERRLPMQERDFQAKLIKELKRRFPGCFVMKLDPGYIQGIPDLLILWGKRWAVLECKKNKKAIRQPNQELYVELLNGMSFSRFIYPENKEEVLHDLEQTFRAGR